MAVVEVEGLVVRYGTLVAVDQISWQAEAGAVTAVLGPNGAGKTSTIEVCEGYRHPSAGQVRVLGLDPARDRRQLCPRMGVMLQDGGVYPSARVRDTVALYCALHGGRVDADELVATVGLEHRSRSSWRRLSGGERQRLSLALALAAHPEVAFLDEPTSGVDVNGRSTIRMILRRLADQGCAVVLATHELDEAERVADHVVIIDRGTVVADGSLDDLRRGADEVRFTSSAALDDEALARHLGRPVERTGPASFCIAAPSDPRLLAELTGWLAEQDLPLGELRAGSQRLEDVFVRLTRLGEDAP